MFDHDSEWGPARHRHQREATLPNTDTQLVMAAPVATATWGTTLLAERRDDELAWPEDN